MITEALKYLVGLAHKDTFDKEGVTFSTAAFKEVKPNKPELPDNLTVCTLSGLVDLFNAKFEEKFGLKAEEVIIHVLAHDQVLVLGRESDDRAQRKHSVTARPPQFDGFKFGQYYSHENFIIATNCFFEPTLGDDLEYILRVARTVTDEKVVSASDTGVAQSLSLKRGVALVTQEAIRTRVKLSPFRTFTEIVQPQSEFIFRVKQEKEGTIPVLTLFEADGGRWKKAAMEEIARFLRTTTESKIPVIC